MIKSVQLFVDRLVERLVPLVATLISSAAQSLHARAQADRQNELEEAARRYEDDGKTEIAATLRRRAAELGSANPLGESLDIVANVAGDDARLLPPAQGRADADLARLPDFNGKPAKSRRKKSAPAPRPEESN